MLKIWTAIFMFLAFSGPSFSAAKWSVQITYPDHELKNFKLDDMEFKTFLPKTSWRCWVGETQFNGKKELKKLRCNYSVEKNGEFSQFVSCGPDSKYSEAVVDLKDEKKKLEFKIHLICRF
jgi:hypothetical protein